MSTLNDNIEEKHPQTTLMVPLSCVSRLKWNSELGEKLKSLRGKTSRRELAEKLKEDGHPLSHQSLQKYEEGRADSISPELLNALCDALNIDLDEFLPYIWLSVSKKFTPQS